MRFITTRIKFLTKSLFILFFLMFIVSLTLYWYFPNPIIYASKLSAIQTQNHSFHTSAFDFSYVEPFPRIICWVCTYPDTKNSVFLLDKLWGQYLAKTIYVSNNTSLLHPLPTLLFPFSHETRRLLWTKTIFSFRYLFARYGDQFHWFMKADDDTFVVPENLHRFLREYNSSIPHYFGRELTINGVIYCSGGGGYIVSRAALKLFINGLDSVCKDQDNGEVEDYEFGRCLNRLGIYPEDSRDSIGRFRFNLLSLRYHYLTPVGRFPKWLYMMSLYPILYGENCCASDVITFHYMNINDSIELSKILLESPKHLLSQSKFLKLY